MSRKHSGRRRTAKKPEAPQNASQELLGPIDAPTKLATDVATLLAEPTKRISDANRFVKLMTLGVVDEETAREVLQRGFDLAKTTDNPKEYAAILKAIEGCAKLAIASDTSRKPSTPGQHIHFHGVADGGVSDSRGDRLAEIAAKMGLSKLAQRCRVGEFSSG